MNGTDAARMKACLTALDTTDRYVVLMYYADELTPSEISIVLDIALSRVNQTLDRFRAAAAAVLKRLDSSSAAPGPLSSAPHARRVVA